MLRRSRVVSLSILLPAAVVLAAVGTVVARQSAPGPRSVPLETDVHRIRVVPVAQGLVHPWSLAFLPDGDLLVAERGGRLLVVRGESHEQIDVPGVPAVHARLHGGLLDIALHPSFAENHFLYFTYATAGDAGATVALARARFEADALQDVEDIFVADAWSRTDLHYGSRIVFAPDGTVYMSVGERTERARAQDLGDHAGTIVRVRDDGSVPDDNPFVGRAGSRPEIFSYGHRNIQGLAIHPETGQLWASEHGPQGGDEVNAIQPGKNYGWPLATFGRDYTGEAIAPPSHPGTELPEVFWVPSIGLSSLTFYRGQRFAGWTGDLFVAGLSGRQVQRVLLTDVGVYGREVILTELDKRVRDVREGPDDLLYIVTDEEDGAVLRIEPDDPPTSDAAARAGTSRAWPRWLGARGL